MLSLPARTFVFKGIISNAFAVFTLLICLTAPTASAQNASPPEEVVEKQMSPPEDPAAELNAPQKPHDPFAYFYEEEKIAKEEPDQFFSQFLKMLATLGMLIGVLFAASWSLKRMLQSRVQQLNVSSSIKVLESRGLSNKSTLYLVEVENKTLLIGETMHNVTLLTSFDTP